MSLKDTIKYIIGIDEVGRGPLAGPVAVCAFMMRPHYELPIDNYEFKLPKLKDSKKLSKKQREEWFEYLKKQKEEGNCDYSVSFVSPEMIDKFGIAKCIQKALNESLSLVTTRGLENYFRFTQRGEPYTINNFQDPASFSLFRVFLDGGLKAPVEYVNQETIIKGDELHPVISMASIVAKVTRDAVMTKYGKEYPEYGFDRHSGYGTKAHYEAIKTHGQTPIHRKTFIHP